MMTLRDELADIRRRDDSLHRRYVYNPVDRTMWFYSGKPGVNLSSKSEPLMVTDGFHKCLAWCVPFSLALWGLIGVAWWWLLYG